MNKNDDFKHYGNNSLKWRIRAILMVLAAISIYPSFVALIIVDDPPQFSNVVIDGLWLTYLNVAFIFWVGVLTIGSLVFMPVWPLIPVIEGTKVALNKLDGPDSVWPTPCPIGLSFLVIFLGWLPVFVILMN